MVWKRGKRGKRFMNNIEQYAMKLIDVLLGMTVEEIKVGFEKTKVEIWKGDLDNDTFRLVEGITNFVISKKENEIQEGIGA